MNKGIMMENSARKRASDEPRIDPHEPVKRLKPIGQTGPTQNGTVPVNHSPTSTQPIPSPQKMEREHDVDFADWTANQTLAKDMRRRSSFMAGRSDCHSAALQSCDLCKNIPESLPPFHRLKELHKAAIEFALSHCTQDFPGNKYSQEFISSGMSELIDSLHAEDLETVTIEKQTSPNTMDPKVQASIRMMEADLERYKAESSAWLETLQEFKTKADHAASRLKGDLEIHNQPKLSAEQNRILAGRPNYQDKLNNLKTLIEIMTVNKQSISSVVCSLKKSSSSCQRILSKCNENLHHKFFEKSPNANELIEACASSDIDS